MQQALNLVSKVGIDGWFRLVVSAPGRGVVRELEFPNIVLDAGLNRLGTDNGIGFCAIGTGTSTPTAVQTTLQAQSASTSTALSGSAVDSGGVSPYWTGYTFVFRFSIGSLNGNYSEVGVGWTSTLMYSRALIVDVGGSPTTITVGATEQLDVYYTRRLYPPLSDVVTTVTIGGVSTTVTTRARFAGSTSSWAANEYPRSDATSGVNAAYSGAIGVLTGSPSGTASSPGTLGSTAYSNNSLAKTLSSTFAPSEGNFGGGIASVGCSFKMFSAQYGFAPAIAKTNSLTLALAFTATWARRP